MQIGDCCRGRLGWSRAVYGPFRRRRYSARRLRRVGVRIPLAAALRSPRRRRRGERKIWAAAEPAARTVLKDGPNTAFRRNARERASCADRQIYRLVYELYELTDEEIAIAEEATAQGWRTDGRRAYAAEGHRGYEILGFASLARRSWR